MTIKRRNKKSGNNTNNQVIKRTAFLSMLRSIYLDGIINECKVNVNKGKAFVECVDMTNSLIVIANQRIMSKRISCEIGIGDIELFIKFLNSVDEDNLPFILTHSTIAVTNQDKSKKLNYLLTEPDLISTTLLNSKSDAKNKITNMTEFSFPISQSLIKDIATYSNMIDAKNDHSEVKIKYVIDESLSFMFGKENTHQFQLNLDHDDTKINGESNESDDEFEIKIDASHFNRILNNINYDEDNPPQLMFAKNAPVVIQINNKKDHAFWAMSTIMDDDGE